MLGERVAQRGVRVGRAREEEIHDGAERGVEVDERRAARLLPRRARHRGRLGQRAQLLEQRAELRVRRDLEEVRRVPRRGLCLVDGRTLVEGAGAAAVLRVLVGRGRRHLAVRHFARPGELRAAGRGAGDDVDEVSDRDPRQADAVVEVLGDALVLREEAAQAEHEEVAEPV